MLLYGQLNEELGIKLVNFLMTRIIANSIQWTNGPLSLNFILMISRIHNYIYWTKCFFTFYSFSLQNFVRDLATMGVRINEVNSEAEKIIRAGHPKARLIRKRQQQLNEK